MPTRILNFLFFLTIFFSSFLLFQVQPLITKVLLPIFGGVPAVWTTCLVFFQSALFLGYLYAYCSVHYITPRLQPAVHALLLILSLITLPLGYTASNSVALEDPTWKLLGLLASMILSPYLLLASSNTLLGSWFSGLNSNSSPYKLYAVSNVASLAALLSFPAIIERRFGSNAQMALWTNGYYCFVLLISGLALLLLIGNSPKTNIDRKNPAPSVSKSGLWILQAGCGSVLLLGITTFITAEIAPMPLLWVLPLAVYLLTFILAFLDRPIYHRRIFGVLLILMLALGGIALSSAFHLPASIVGPKILIVGSLVILFLTCMICHGELALSKPSSEDLGIYYLFISLGGMLGGIFAGILAPHIFVHYVELPLALILCLALRAVNSTMTAKSKIYLLLLGCIGMAIITGERHVPGEIAAFRNFFGTLVVKQLPSDNPASTVVGLVHGKTIHGLQFVNPEKLLTPIGYYGPRSGIGLVLNDPTATRPRVIGAIGLGVGSIAAYGKSGDSFRFYEINPGVISLAKQYFAYLNHSAAKIEIVEGDARLSLARESSQQFDVLLIDAFNGDSLPLHLMTVEAFKLYLAHLKPGGILVFHVSNHYVDLRPPILEILKSFNIESVVISEDENPAMQWRSNRYIVASTDSSKLLRPELSQRVDQETYPAERAGHGLWTDDYSSIVPYLLN